MTSYPHLADMTITLTASDATGATVTVAAAQDAVVWGQTLRAICERERILFACLDSFFMSHVKEQADGK